MLLDVVACCWATHAHYAWFTKTYGLYPYYGALQVPTLLGVGASVCTQPKDCVMAVLLVRVVYSASYASFFAMELEKSLVNDDIRATCKTNLSPKHYIKRYKQQELPEL